MSSIVQAANGPRYIEVEHREYLFDLYTAATTGGLSSQLIVINPGLLQTFPWFSNMAAGFEQYEPLAIQIEFKSTSSNFANATALGKVVIAAEYNVDSVQPAGTAMAGQPYSSTQEMENSEFARVGRTDQSFTHTLDCASMYRPTKLLYVRNGQPTARSGVVGTLKFHDLANVQIATIGCPATNTNIGEVWIRARFRFYKPVLNAGLLGRTIITQQWKTWGTGLGTGQSLSYFWVPNSNAYGGANANWQEASTNTVGSLAPINVEPVGWQDKFYFYATNLTNMRLYFPSWIVNGTFRFRVIGSFPVAAVGTGNWDAITYAGTLTPQPKTYNDTTIMTGIPIAAAVGSVKIYYEATFFVNGPPTSPISNYIQMTNDSVTIGPTGTPVYFIFVDQINDYIDEFPTLTP